MRVKPRYISRVFVVLVSAMIAGEWSVCIERSHSIQAEAGRKKKPT